MIRFENLSKTYPDGTQALKGVNLTLHAGVIGLLGPNGAGKTTLMSILVMTLQPSCGQRWAFDVDAASSRHHTEIRRRLGYLPQDFSPVASLTALEYLVHCGRLRLSLPSRQLNERAEALLEMVDLLDARNHLCRDFSGGMRRRLGIAQALIHAPSLVVVDEPTAGLDATERIRLRDLLAKVGSRCAVLLSTHIVEDVETTCERIVILLDGRIVFDGRTDVLMAAAEGRLWLLHGTDTAPPGTRHLGSRVGNAGESLRLVLADQPVPGAQRRAASLEDAYAAYLASQRPDRA
jgi:ABC-type multidrug transport system ATPase subunit